MVKTGMVTPIYYTDLVAPSGEILVSRDVPELLPFTYYYKEVFGKPPSGIKYEALKAANMSSTNMTRMVLMPPRTPPEVITILRQAFDTLAKDQDFLDDAIRPSVFSRALKSASQEKFFQTSVANLARSYQFSPAIHRAGQ